MLVLGILCWGLFWYSSQHNPIDFVFMHGQWPECLESVQDLHLRDDTDLMTPKWHRFATMQSAKTWVANLSAKFEWVLWYTSSGHQPNVSAKWDVVLDLILGVATSVDRFFLYQPECPSNILTTSDLDFISEMHYQVHVNVTNHLNLLIYPWCTANVCNVSSTSFEGMSFWSELAQFGI